MMPALSKRRAKSISFLAIVLLLTAIIISSGFDQLRTPPNPGLSNNTADLPHDVFAGGPASAPSTRHQNRSRGNRFKVNDAPALMGDKAGLRLPQVTSNLPAAATNYDKKSDSDEDLTLTVVLKRTDQQGFDDFLQTLQDPQSPNYHHYLAPQKQAERYGPSRQAYDEVRTWLTRQGFRVIEGSTNRLTLTVVGTRKRAEKAFGVELAANSGERGTFYIDNRPALPNRLESHFQAVIGFLSLAEPRRPSQRPVYETIYAAPGHYVAQMELQHIQSYCEAAASVAADNHPTYRYCLAQPDEINGGYCSSVYKDVKNAAYRACVKSGGKTVSEENGPNGPGPTGPSAKVPPASDSVSPSFSRAPLLRPAASPYWLGIDGTGQTIALLEFDTFNINDIKDYLALAGYPATDINRLSQVHVNGGAQLGPEESEVLIDIIAVMSNARGAKVVVYDAPFTSIRTSFQTLFNRMISDNVTVISNSWVYCEDQTSAADVQSIDSVLASAAAAGITVLNSTGDFGSQCVDGSGNTISVPADSPHATAVGGTSLTTGPALTYASEMFWNGMSQTPPTGAGGFGVSRFFSRPTYQNGFTSSPTRSVPDVSVNADPAKGIQICQADAGGCPTGATYAGTSLSAPIWAAFVALLNQAQGQNLGELNPRLYPLGNSNAFHSAASMGSDFQHVGLGSPNLNLIHRALTNKTTGVVSATVSEITADPAGATADGNAEAFVVVRLRDADGHTISGKTVTLSGNSGSHAIVSPASGVSNVSNGAVVFSIKDTVPEFVTFTATDATDGVVLQTQIEVVFVSPPAAAGGISANPTTVNANGSDATTITVTLQDAKGNPSSGKLVNLSQGNGSSIISATTATTDATGKVQFTAVDNTNETVTYTAVDVTDQNLPVPGSATVTFSNKSGFCSSFGRFGIGTTTSAYSVTTFASNFPFDCFPNLGPEGVAFDRNGTLFVADIVNNNLYAFGQNGGTAGPATLVGTVSFSAGASLSGIAFTKDGRLYGMLGNGNNVVEIDPATAAVKRTVVHIADGGARFGLAVDPLSGDLFASGFGGIERISNFASGPGTVTHYTSGDFDGIAFAPDGTLYAAGNSNGGIYRVAGTNSPTPGAATLIASLPGVPNGPDGIAIEPNASNPSRPILYVNRNDGTITRIDTSLLPDTPTGLCATGCSDIYTGGSRGDFVTVGPSGCLYATQTDRVIRITKADGTCSLTPTNLAPQIALTPENVQPSPAQGTTATLTAQVKNAANLADIPVTLFVSGANSIARLARTDATGKATITYTGVFAGADQAFASADLSGSVIFSNTSQVTWTSGKHSTFLTLNQSPSSGFRNQPLPLTATLVDVSVTPATAVSGVPVTFTVAGQTCMATTNAAGTAACSVTPSVAAGTYPLTATFAGNGSLVPSSANKTVDLLDAPVVSNVEFSTANYSVTEDCTTLTITVNRTGDTSFPATVDYSSADGSATERGDYITALGTLNFAAGETSKSFVVLINEDSYVEGNEGFTLNLSNPSGVGFGANVSTTVTIIDDATEPATNAIDDPRNLVCQQYHDFLNRQPDQSGWDFWTNEITSCGTDQPCIEVKRINVSAAFFLSIEFQNTGYLVERLYKVAYGDDIASSTIGGSHQLPVPVIRFKEFLLDTQRIGRGLVVLQPGWEQLLENNKQAFVSEFVQRPRFAATLPVTLTPAQFVDKLNQNAGNVLSSSERASLINSFGSAGNSSNLAARAQVGRQVAEDSDLHNAENNRAFVLMQYLGYLRRNPNDPQDTDYSGYDFWLAKLNQFGGNYQNAEMVKAFLISIEYRRRFGP